MEAMALARAGSFLVSPFSKRVFWSRRIWPGSRAAALAWASGPTTSSARITGLPSSSLRRAATGSMRSSARDFFHFSSVMEASSLPFSSCFFL